MSDIEYNAMFDDYVSFIADFGIISTISVIVDPTVTEDSSNPVASSGIYSFVKEEIGDEAEKRRSSDELLNSKINDAVTRIPTKTSDLTNDSGFITEADIPSIPTKTSQLTNDSGFITSADVPAPYDDTEIREEISGLDDKIKDLELFKFPNVTIIGTPTINNGQISDFSATSYLKFPFLVDFRSQPFEINMAFTTGANVVQQENIFDSDFGLAFAIRNSRFVIAISTNGTSWDLGEGVGTLTVQPNTTYYIKIAWNGSQYILYYSFDGVSYTPDITKAGTAQPYPKQIYIGVGENFASVVNHFGGTINLNNANLKVNGEVFWTGMDDAGISTRADVSLSNLDSDGRAKIKEVAETDSIKSSLNNKIEDSALTPLRNNISTLTSQMASKQDKLVSGTNIRTINGKSLLGSGDIPVGGSSEPVQLNIADHLSTTPARITNVADLSFDSNMNFSFTVKPTTGYENLILALGSLDVGSEYLLEYDVTLNSDPTFSGSYAYETYVSAGIPRPETNNSYDNLPRTRGETKHYSMAFFNEISGIPMYLCFFMPIISSANTSYTVSNLKLSVKEYSGASESEIEQIKADLTTLDDRVDVLEKMSKGILYDFITQTAEGNQTVPKGGHMADIQKLLGHTIVADNSLKSVNNTKVTVGTVDYPLVFNGKSVDTVRDEIDFVDKEYIKRVGSVDLGDLRWSDNGAYEAGREYVCIVNDKANGITNMISGEFTVSTERGFDRIRGRSGSKSISICSTDTNLSSFVNSLKSKLLFYELAEPIATVITDIDSIEVKTNDTMVFNTEVPLTSTIEYLRYLNEV